MNILFVTGTGTGVGKTVATAALAACAAGTVAVVKLAQTGVAPGEPGDLAEVTRLSGCIDVHEFARYPDPLSPYRAARHVGAPRYDVETAILRIAELAKNHDHVIVEGAGGLLVPYDPAGTTIADMPLELNAQMVVVTSASLGTINHTALTVRYIEENCGVGIAGLVIGSWPREPDLAERYNVWDLGLMGGREKLAGVLPAGMATMADFAGRARRALSPAFGGTFDFPSFWQAVQP
ncbi:MAG: dethiobiotin synthase [Actinomycetota bacterium]|nr:dethiobiotin synthase [Actinomycetota bacterium]